MKQRKIIITLLIAVLAAVSSQAQSPCTPVNSILCKSIVADTVFNPYVTGVLGNWRANKSYTYYARRTEQDPSTLTNVRKDGAFNDYTSFWSFQNKKLAAAPDTGRWVWNSELTLFNRKGFEVENRDPLGRYNAGLYGYNLTMPIAVVQNSRYRESAFEGFEDYVFTTQLCDTACPSSRHIDYSDYRSWMDTTEKHTGKRSLKLPANTQVGLSFSLKAASSDTGMPRLVYALQQDTCNGQQALTSVKTSNKILLPVFAPTPGKMMVVSAWIKEQDTALLTTYTRNRIRIVWGSTNTDFRPTGSIIEGWQRYEGIFKIPDTATTLTVSLQTTGAVAAWFDDLRIHPFNANMKSFVFHPVNLRLMAELDENNYATLYEYDDEGTLIRLKKETQRGIKTIKETRSALVKQ